MTNSALRWRVSANCATREASFDAKGTLLTLAAGGCLATWQGDRLIERPDQN